MPDAAQPSVLTVNAGSRSLKLALVRDGTGPAGLDIVDELTFDGAPDGPDAADALRGFLERAGDVTAVGHRIVHGGASLTSHRIVDDGVVAALEDAAEIAPLHVPPALAALRMSRQYLPAVPHVACLDTVFHAGLPEPARTYAIPREWRDTYGLRRYGFHGLSYAWTLDRAIDMLARPASEVHIVLTHLGGGASVCAVRDGVSVSTSMGFTPLEGLAMSRRSGSVDPGMLLWLQRSKGLSADEIFDGLEHRSGLLGVSNGLSGDTRDLVAAARAGNAAAQLSLDVFTLRARQEIAAAAASLDRVDAIVFSGEIGADQPEVREAIAAGLGVLGVRPGLDEAQDTDHVLSTAGTPVLLVHPDEQRQIAREVHRVVDTL